MSNQQEHWLITKAKKELEDAKQRQKQAYEKTPPQYHQFLVLLQQPKKIGELDAHPENVIHRNVLYENSMWVKEDSRNNNKTKYVVYVNLELPYMTVDGRVQWARDDHREQKAKLDIDPVYIPEQKLYRTKVVSELYGSAVGTAIVNVGGVGVDRTNPIENSETSSIGRALGFLGFGLIGTGIASLEEATAATVEAQRITDLKETPNELPTEKKPDTKPEGKIESETVPKKDSQTKESEPKGEKSDSPSTTSKKPSSSKRPEFSGYVSLQNLSFQDGDRGMYAELKVVDENGQSMKIIAGSPFFEQFEEAPLAENSRLAVRAQNVRDRWVMTQYRVETAAAAN